jgi:hypothetical protein
MIYVYTNRHTHIDIYDLIYEGENKENISEHHMTKSVTSVRTCCWLTPSWTALRPWKILGPGMGGWFTCNET